LLGDNKRGYVCRAAGRHTRGKQFQGEMNNGFKRPRKISICFTGINRKSSQGPKMFKEN